MPTWLVVAIVALVALAMAWIEEERTPSSNVAPESSASKGSADDDARSSAPWASSSMTPGASGNGRPRLAPLGDQSTADGAGEQGGGVTEQFDVAFLKLGLSGAADENQCSPCRAVGDERAAELWTKARRGQQVAKAWAALRVTGGRVAERRGLALSMGELLELVDVLDGVLVIRQNWEAVRDVLEPMLGDQV